MLRLARQAEAKGVRILHNRAGEHFATSATEAHLLYPVDPATGCTCLAAVHGGLGGHLGLLLSELGLLGDEDAQAEDGEPAPGCQECSGSGMTRMYYAGRLSDWVVGALIARVI